MDLQYKGFQPDFSIDVSGFPIADRFVFISQRRNRFAPNQRELLALYQVDFKSIYRSNYIWFEFNCETMNLRIQHLTGSSLDRFIKINDFNSHYSYSIEQINKYHPKIRESLNQILFLARLKYDI